MGLVLSELVALLETAKEGSRELDGMVCVATLDVAIPGDTPCLWGPTPAGAGSNVVEIEALGRVQPYTSSLDAALGLVPKGWDWQIGTLSSPSRAAPALRATVFHDRMGMVLANEYCEGRAQTAPIALCIAALRARAVLSGPAPPRAALSAAPPVSG